MTITEQFDMILTRISKQNMSTTKISKQAQEFTETNNLSEEINQAYIDNVGAEYATAEDVQEAYSGDFFSDEEFAEQTAQDLGLISEDAIWPNNCIDWEDAASELMNDYFEVDGHYFRNL